jgi:hypothetical protein
MIPCAENPGIPSNHLLFLLDGAYQFVLREQWFVAPLTRFPELEIHA